MVLNIGNTISNVYISEETITLTAAGSLIDKNAGSNIGDMVEGGGLAAAFDDDYSQTQSSCATKSSTNIAYIGKTLPSTKPISRAIVYGSSDIGFTLGAFVSLRLYGKVGTAPSDGNDGTLLASSVIFSDEDTEQNVELISLNTTTAWDHVWITITSSSSHTTFSVAEVDFFEMFGGGVFITPTLFVIGNNSTNCTINSSAIEVGGVNILGEFGSINTQIGTLGDTVNIIGDTVNTIGDTVNTIVDEITSIDASINTLSSGLGTAQTDISNLKSITPAEVLLANGTISNKATANISLTSYQSYRGVKIIIYGFIGDTDGADLIMRFSSDGTNYDAGAGNYKWTSYRDYVSGSAAASSSSDTSIHLGDPLPGNDAIGGSNFNLTMLGIANTARHPTMFYDGVQYASDDNIISSTGAGRRLATQATKGVQFLFDSGNITSGFWALYGIN